MKRPHDSTPKNSARQKHLDNRLSKAVFSFASGTFSKREIRAMFKELHPLEIIWAVVHQKNQAGTGKPETINRLVELLGAEKVYAPKRENEPYLHCADITKIKTQLGWQPEVSFEDGVREIVENFNAAKAA